MKNTPQSQENTKYNRSNYLLSTQEYSQRRSSSGYSDPLVVPCAMFTRPSSFTLIAYVLTGKGGCENSYQFLLL